VSRLESLPYLVASRERVRAEAWHLRLHGLLAPLEELLPHWEPSTPLEFTRRVCVDTEGVLEDCSLSPDTALRLVVAWRSPGTTMRSRGAVSDLEPSRGSIDLNLKIPGELLAGRLILDTQVVLPSSRLASEVLAPRRAGSVLWSDTRVVRLEGEGTRFPTEWRDFSTLGSGVPADACWYLEWTPGNLHEMALGSMRLFLNSARHWFRDILTAGGQSPVSAAMESAMQFDVGRALIQGALDNDEFLSDPRAFDDDSIGGRLRRLLILLFPGETPETLRYNRGTDPQGFEATLQAKLRLFQRPDWS
jgi:hypothetical protein